MRYQTVVSDSDRWIGFPFREGDIIISTPPKCGTTWTQMLCAMLVFDSTTFDRPLAKISPWLDMLTRSLPDVLADLDAQTHRRFIKTHTPLDGLPHDDRVTYLCVGRDPRDVALSWDHHMSNIDFEALINLRAAAVGLDDLAGMEPPPPPAEAVAERFWQWVDDEDVANSSLASLLNHVQTFWARRDEPNVALFHYGDMKTDLPGQLSRLANVLGIDCSPARVAALADAATFEHMKEGASRLAPNSDQGFWLSTDSFFHRGASGQWRELLEDVDLARYDTRVRSLVDDDVARWVHDGWRAAAPA